MTPDEITAVLARWYEAFSRHNAVALSAEYADDCVVESPVAGRLVGRAAVETAWKSSLSTFLDEKSQREGLLISGDEAVLTVQVWGTDMGGFLGQPPTGKPFNLFVVFLFVFDQGQIVRERRVYDVMGLLTQLGSDIVKMADVTQMYRATLERTRLENELQIAAQIQQALLPQAQHRGPFFEAAAASMPCRAIGGDFFDYFDLPDGSLGVALGDIAGKGPPAALLAAELQGLLAAHSSLGGSPADIMSRVNEAFMRRPVESRFATLTYGVLGSNGVLTHCNAGHNPPLVVGSSCLRRLTRGGLIVGAFKQSTFEEETSQLTPGDTVIVYSDGVTEALNAAGDEFGEKQLISCVESNRHLPAPSLLQCTFDAVRQFSGEAPQGDDLTILVLRYTGSR